MNEGLSKGTMLPYIKRAREAGYAVMILRPNANTVEVSSSSAASSSNTYVSGCWGNEGLRKVPIVGSETPEIHVLGVWDTLISRAEGVKFIALLGFGNGAPPFVQGPIPTPNGSQ
jgi:hypothetical protein